MVVITLKLWRSFVVSGKPEEARQRGLVVSMNHGSKQ